MAIDFTKAQQTAIDSRGALLVSAAAGSGKTAVLVERVVQCILDKENPVDVDRMLVVTFTKAAAGEMRQRIQDRLATEFAKDPTNTRILRQQMLLQKANICTIDSFCKNLITQYFEQLDISPDFNIISENTLKTLKKEALNETMDLFLKTKKEALSELAEILGADQDTKNLASAIDLIHKHMQSLPCPKDWADRVQADYLNFSGVEQAAWGKAIFDRSERMAERCHAFLQGVTAQVQFDPLIEQKRGEILRTALMQLEDVLGSLRARNWDEVRLNLDKLQPISFKTAQLRGSDFDVTLKNQTVTCQVMVDKVRETLQKLFALRADECKEECDFLAPYVQLLFEAVEEYRRRIDEKKKDKNALDFSDLESLALQLLVEYRDGKAVTTPLGKTICQAYTYVMVDEFQDINTLQAEIFGAISDDGKRLFAVGDVKQSIYRFRKANPDIFLRMMKRLPVYEQGGSSGRWVLDGNFRSRVGLCQTVNAFFRLVMSEYAGDLDYNEDHQLVPMGSFPDSTVPAVELSFFHGDDERGTIELEADLIANRIKEAMTVPCVTEKGQLRNAKPGDCVILLRSLKNRASLYEERLRQHGFSVIAEQDEDFFERKEVMWTVSLLQALNNPTDDVAMLATMLSPWCGFTADRLAMLRAEHSHLPLAVCLERAAAAGNVSAKTVHENLERFRVKSATTSVDRLLGYIYDTYGILSAVRVMKNGNQCRNNLLALQALAKECSDNGYDRLDGFLRYIKKLQEEKATVSVPAVACDSNAVRIMSIHHSKGLQFPICFVAGCANGFNKMDSTAPILLDVNLGLGLTLTDDKLQMRRSTCMRQAVATEVARSSISEELRVLYVAMTRGIDRLILLTALNNPEKNISDAVMDLDSGNMSDTQALRLDPELVLSASGYGKWLLYFALLHPSGGQLQSYANTNYGYLPAEAEHCDIRLWHARQIEPPAPLQVPQERVRCADSAMVSRLQAQLNYDDPYKPLQRMFAKRSVSQLVHDTPHVSRHETHAPRPSFLQEGGLSATERGTALHTFMQYADYPAAATDFGGELERLVAQGFMTQQQADGVDRSKAAAFFAGPLYQRMARSPRVMREHRFMSQIPVTQLDPTLPEKFENERVVVQGITDCVFEEDGQLVVVDYKTDRVKEIGELADRYAEQLRLYAHMLTEDMGMPIKELILYSFHLGTSLSL